LLAIAITRLPAGVDFLLEVLAAEDADAASAALTALAIHRHNPAVRERVATTVGRKGNELKERFDREFGRPG
jgi:hypothetical protein